MRPSRLLRTTALVVPFALSAAAADAADLVDTIKQTDELGTFGKAIESAGMSEQLKGEGPYTIFAPSDEAFDKLPQNALDRLMQDGNQAQLQSLLAQHVVEGKEIAASDVVGQQTKLSTLEGEQLTVDGTSQAVILVPTGLTITRTGDQIVVEREAAAVAAPSVEVRPTQSAAQSEQSQQQGSQSQQQAAEMSDSDENPEARASQRIAEEARRADQEQEARPSERQQQDSQGQQQASEMSGSEENPEARASEQIARDTDRAAQQQDQPSAQAGTQQQGRTEQQQTPLAEDSDMPATEHQQEALKTDPDTEQQQTAEQASVPSTEHQREVIRDGEAQSGQGVLREAQVVRPDIEADNGVIHIVDAVLVPQKVLSMLESGSAKEQQPSQQGQQ